jgi:hypothetical protein
MQSDQETVLEEFMQSSFGAQQLYVPRKFSKGAAQREPADLAWSADGLVVLFYMTASTKKLEDQIEHNRRQAIGYHRLWSKNKPQYALKGKNRFGDECSASYDSVQIYLTLLVVSDECGIDILEPITRQIKNAVIVVPEMLLHWVAEFGGSIVDLLTLINIFLSSRLEASKKRNDDFAALSDLVSEYVQHSIKEADPEGRYLTGTPQHDYLVLHKYLSDMKVPASIGQAFATPKFREEVSRIFGDMRLIEYATLAAAAETAITASEPPTFKKFMILKTRGHYYTFVVATIDMGSSNSSEVVRVALENSKNKAGELDSIGVFYGNVANINEYRLPLMFSLPPKLPKRHALVLAESIVQKGEMLSRQEGNGIAT